ncbi:d7887dab-17f2-440b-9e60-8b7ea39e059c [Sclerotinia trifoliorum]|uniref:D7887dab-17f2-440b-9e60-8b7ea39e059c n=1 Tax=Sclerotinia trifoliorum TaxID=28548 RepID=A0A8H2ZLP7_9HELO|nr:d7887dab-17f2-440b-9e60-8b7ea39e059c [Sclerotinia trifoliorum]
MASKTSPTALTPSRPLHITIRFADSIPDLLLDIPTQNNITGVGLKHLIRSKLKPPASQRRFRFIYGGKFIRDDDFLTAILKVPTPPPRAIDVKGKGKDVEPPPARVYINCSIGDDVLSPSEIEAETIAATAALNKPKKTKLPDGASSSLGTPASSTTVAPRGFNRFLSAGFSPAEVNQLRLQFQSIQASIHTPDTMPSPDTLLRMEDSWIDNNAGNGAIGTEGGFDFGDDGMGSGFDDLLWGNIMGFLWPLGCVVWVLREPGILSSRRQIAVFTGFLLSITFGFLRVLS